MPSLPSRILPALQALAVSALALGALTPPPPALAQSSSPFATPETEQRRVVNSICYAFAENRRQPGPKIWRAALLPENLGPSEVGLAYVGHSTFLIETASGITVATDYAGYAGPQILPEVVTMNHAHETHYTDYPDPRIEHVLRGWDPEGGRAEHDLDLEEIRIRNVTTDIRGWGGVEKDGNSIFIFEVADMCIGHLGHLHHKPTVEQFAEIGFLDVVLAPVDGVYTMTQTEMIDTLKTLRARLVIPMHAFGPSTTSRFLEGMRDEFEIVISDKSTITLSSATLPEKPTVMALPPYYVRSSDE
ncbi:MAG: MBL fold metallo-hydrolase [Rhodobacteraceae bacterium]|nr:MBL fold metallo-hydrolase [Paracoccaceae bacterium]